MPIISKTKEQNECGVVETTIKYTDTSPWWMGLLRMFKAYWWVALSAGLAYIASNISQIVAGFELSDFQKGLILAIILPIIAGIQKGVDVKKEQSEPVDTPSE